MTYTTDIVIRYYNKTSLKSIDAYISEDRVTSLAGAAFYLISKPSTTVTVIIIPVTRSNS